MIAINKGIGHYIAKADVSRNAFPVVDPYSLDQRLDESQE